MITFPQGQYREVLLTGEGPTEINVVCNVQDKQIGSIVPKSRGGQERYYKI